MGILLTSINGAPVSVLLTLGSFNGFGQNTTPFVAPFGLSGLDLGFTSAGFWQTGVLGFSNEVIVTFL